MDETTIEKRFDRIDDDNRELKQLAIVNAQQLGHIQAEQASQGETLRGMANHGERLARLEVAQSAIQNAVAEGRAARGKWAQARFNALIALLSCLVTWALSQVKALSQIKHLWGR